MVMILFKTPESSKDAIIPFDITSTPPTVLANTGLTQRSSSLVKRRI